MTTLDPRALNRISEAVTEHWGERCPDFDESCPTCQAWEQFDSLAALSQPQAGEPMEPLGADFEAVWDKNVAGLYECDPAPQPALAVKGLNDLPERNLNEPAEQQGLFRKFDVRRVDGSDAPGGKHHGCRYFVLDVDHDQHAMAALSAYAAACETTHPELACDLREKWGASLTAAIGAGGQDEANIVPEGCTGKAFAFDPGVLHVNKDGSGYIAVDEGAWELEDDRCEGPDGPQGSVHWITRLAASEMQALRDFLNGSALVSPPPSGEVEALRAAWLLTGGPDGQFSKVVFGLENLKREAIAAVLGDGEDASEEAQDMRDRLDTPGDWEGDHWSISWSFEDGYLNVQRITDLSSLSSAPATADGWRTMEDAPKDGARVLLWAKQWEAPSTGQFYGTFWNINGQLGPFAFPPTHWQPLPAAPTATGGR